MAVANKIAYNREDDAEGLERDVPAGTNDLGRLEPELKKDEEVDANPKNHASRED